MTCEWCNGNKILNSTDTVYWELPDGTRAIEINDTPTIVCEECQMSYQPEENVKAIENQLLLIDTKTIPSSITYSELMNRPRLLKKNYFDFFT